MKLLPGYYNLGQPKKITPTADHVFVERLCGRGGCAV